MPDAFADTKPVSSHSASTAPAAATMTVRLSDSTARIGTAIPAGTSSRVVSDNDMPPATRHRFPGDRAPANGEGRGNRPTPRPRSPAARRRPAGTGHPGRLEQPGQPDRGLAHPRQRADTACLQPPAHERRQLPRRGTQRSPDRRADVPHRTVHGVGRPPGSTCRHRATVPMISRFIPHARPSPPNARFHRPAQHPSPWSARCGRRCRTRRRVPSLGRPGGIDRKISG
jgi:hypothetical protein